MAFKYTKPPTATCRVCGEDWAEDCVHDGRCSMCDAAFQACYEIMRAGDCGKAYWVDIHDRTRASCDITSEPCAEHYTDCPLHKEKL